MKSPVKLPDKLMKSHYEMVPTKNETFHNRVWHYTHSSAGTCLFIIIKVVTTSRLFPLSLGVPLSPFVSAQIGQTVMAFSSLPHLPCHCHPPLPLPTLSTATSQPGSTTTLLDHHVTPTTKPQGVSPH